MYENFVIDLDLLQTSRFPLWRGKMLSNHFQRPCDAINNFLAKCKLLSIFLVCLPLRIPQAFCGGRESCAYFRNNIPFFRPSSYFRWSNDFDNQQHFVSNFLWLIVCNRWAGIFVNKFCHSSKTIVMCRGVTRLDVAWDKKKVWRPHVRTWGLWEANVLFWESACGIVSFGPRSDSASGEYSPRPLVTFLVLCNKNRICSKNKQIFISKRHELLFHKHLHFLEHNTAWILHRLPTKVVRGNSGFFV